MDLTSLEGESFGPYPMRVCLEKVREFTAVTSDDQSRWREAAPPGYLAAALFVVAPDLLSKLDGHSVLHGEQSFVWHRPLTMETDLLISGYVNRVRERGGTFFVGFDVTVTTTETEVASASSLFLVSESSGNGVEEASEPDPDDRGNPSESQRSASRSDLVRYAAATRDWNPIHWDHAAAVAAGVPGVIAHGLLQAAWALEAASRGFDNDRPFAAAKVRFRNPLRPAQPVDVDVERGDGEVKVTISDGPTQFVTARVELAGE